MYLLTVTHIHFLDLDEIRKIVLTKIKQASGLFSGYVGQGDYV